MPWIQTSDLKQDGYAERRENNCATFQKEELEISGSLEIVARVLSILVAVVPWLSDQQ